MKNDTEYQFRIKLSPTAASCHCVNLSFVINQTFVQFQEWTSLWCGTEQPTMSSSLCATENRARTLLSQVVTVTGKTSPCDGDHFSNKFTDDIAVAYEDTAFGTCPENQSFPLMPMSRSDR